MLRSSYSYFNVIPRGLFVCAGFSPIHVLVPSIRIAYYDPLPVSRLEPENI
jgi:hypothetical protein